MERIAQVIRLALPEKYDEQKDSDRTTDIGKEVFGVSSVILVIVACQ